MTVWYKCLIGNRNQRITTHGISISLLLLIFVLNTAGCFYAFKTKNINMGQPTPHGIYPHMTPQTHMPSIIEYHLIFNMYTIWSLSFFSSWLRLWWVSPHEILDSWFILELGVILHILMDSSIAISPIWVSPFLKFHRKSNTKGIYVTCVATTKPNLENLCILFQQEPQFFILAHYI